MAAYATDFVTQHLSQYQANPDVDYWEGHNEPVLQTVSKMALYGLFEAERVRLMASYGLKCAVGNFSTGNPPFEQWDDFFPALRAVKQHGGALALHEYSAPVMDYGFDRASGEGWLTCRYRQVYRRFVPPDLQVPILITETGIDGLVTDRPGPSGSGWQDFIDYWKTLPLDRDPFWAYLDQLQWYDEELQKDEFVIGAAIFVAGALDNFGSYEIAGEMGELFTRYLAAHPAPV
jgi:hypothetical protein